MRPTSSSTGTSPPCTAQITISRACRVGNAREIASSQSGKSTGGRNSPPAKASPNITTWTTAIAAFDGIP